VASAATGNSDLPKAHPELFHYTTLDGLRGIIGTESLWAAHYSTLNDSTEIKFVRQAIRPYIAENLCSYLKLAARQRLSIQRAVRKFGGLRKAFDILSEPVISAVHGAAFESVNGAPPLHEPFIASFCSHVEDGEYEREHGLLSQWRGYGGVGGYCIVFDTARLVEIMERESRRYIWSYMDIDEVVYSSNKRHLYI
jgi:hypothetical protein